MLQLNLNLKTGVKFCMYFLMKYTVMDKTRYTGFRESKRKLGLFRFITIYVELPTFFQACDLTSMSVKKREKRFED